MKIYTVLGGADATVNVRLLFSYTGRICSSSDSQVFMNFFLGQCTYCSNRNERKSMAWLVGFHNLASRNL